MGLSPFSRTVPEIESMQEEISDLQDLIIELEQQVSQQQDRIDELMNTEYTVGIVYPLTGRLEWWGQDVLPILESAKEDIRFLLEEAGSRVRISFLRLRESTLFSAWATAR